MSIRKEAIFWLERNYGKANGPVVTSKYYRPEESWPKKSVWWFQIPIRTIEENSLGHINLLCQSLPEENKFYYLKVPVRFLIDNLDKFHVVKDNISIYLSTDTERLFIEERGTGNLNFRSFLVDSENS